MQAKIIVFPNDDGFNVLVCGTWIQGHMRVRRFDSRIAMTTLLETLHLISAEEAKELESFDFLESCPLYSTEVDEDLLTAHGFQVAN